MAWASRKGIEALFSNDDFNALVLRGQFRLVVGMDAVTDTAALEALSELEAENSGLNVSVFVHDRPWLFHPKLWWFLRPDGTITTVIGSGNLTAWGLRSNWEASSVAQLTGDDATRLREQLGEFLDEHQRYLRSSDDEEALRLAADNSGTERSIRRRIGAVRNRRPAGDPAAGNWLITELSKSRKNSAGDSMFSQASFPQAIFENFFGYTEGGMDLQLFSVDDDGHLGPIENTRGRYKPKSVNFYFELGAARGLAYPAEGHPVALFHRAETGEFTYMLLLPGTPGFESARSLLPPPNGNRKRRALLARADVERAWPTSPLLTAHSPTE